MPRDIPIGNGNLLVTHDQSYVLRDIYYPFVGRENHTDGHGFRFGVRVDGAWKFNLGYVPESLVTHVQGTNDNLQVTLLCHDVVDYRENIYLKKMILRNLSGRVREFRVFLRGKGRRSLSIISDALERRCAPSPAPWRSTSS